MKISGWVSPENILSGQGGGYMFEILHDEILGWGNTLRS